MGLKTLKEHFHIEHIVHRTRKGICIGSAYCPELIVIDNSYNVEKDSIVNGYEVLGVLCDELQKAKGTGELQQAINAIDDIGKKLPVYYEESGRIIKTYCEEYGFPNITIEGDLMYDNVYFKTRQKALEYHRKGFVYSMKLCARNFKQAFGTAKADITNLSFELWRYFRLWIMRGH